ncbi:MAG: phytanoyl-CoA dioxygenase family protein [Kofleriaceae bacterium]
MSTSSPPPADPAPLASAVAGVGWAVTTRLLDDAALAAAQAACDRALATAPLGPYGAIVHDAWRGDPALAALVPTLAPVAAAALGLAEVVLFQDHLIAKPAGGDHALPWHQDFSFWPLDRPDGVTLWLALDDVDLDSGGLGYVSGSHLGGERAARWGLVGPDDPRARLPPLDDALLATATIPTVSAGAALLHHPLTWHASGANRSPRPRRAWSSSWLAATVAWAPEHAPHPATALVRPAAGAPLDARYPRFTAPGLAAPAAAGAGGSASSTAR